jgi:Ca2+-transporting ATPase
MAETMHTGDRLLHAGPDQQHGASGDWHAMTADQALTAWESTSAGLKDVDIAARVRRFGENRLVVDPPEPAWRIFFRQFASVVVALLVVATLLALATGGRADAIAIAAVLVLNLALGFTTELRARRAMEALLSLQVSRAVALRDGVRQDIPATSLVPGDVMVLEEGMSVAADGRLLHAADLQIVEASLTGESVPVRKRAGGTLPAQTTLPDRVNMVHAGTTVVTGGGRAVVVATGMQTEVGRVGALTRGIGDRRTPLERRIDALGRSLAVIAIGAGVLIGLVQSWQGMALGAVLATMIAVAIAAVPEGLPVVVTIAMAAGVRRMARRSAVVRRLSIVESIGEATVVCTDKTGTLTVGEMTVTRLWTTGAEYEVTGNGYVPEGQVIGPHGACTVRDDRVLARALTICVLANRADLLERDHRWITRGDPTEIALLVAAEKAKLCRADLASACPEVAELPFSSERMLMATIHRLAHPHQREGNASPALRAFVKGAPHRVLARCNLDPGERTRLLGINRDLAAQGLRVLALAERPLDDTTDIGSVSAIDRALHDLHFAGFIGMTDPAAPGVKQTIARLRGAGIRTLMLTGDQRATANAVARALGVLGGNGTTLDGSVVDSLSDDELREHIVGVGAISRVSPDAKLRVVRALQARQEIVIMLGDGVNDAPALRQADVGVAMGGRGTDVAKEAADVVLENDRFETVAVAVEQGRAIFDNVRRFVFYLLGCNLAEIAVLATGGLVGAVAPLVPLQILWINLVTDTTPALALALEPSAHGVMSRPPRKPGSPLLSARLFRAAVGISVLITVATLMAFVAGERGWWLQGYATSVLDAEARGRTYAFMTIALAQLWIVSVARWSGRSGKADVRHEGRLRVPRVANPYAWWAVAVTSALQVASAYVPPIARVLQIAPLGVGDWAVIAIMSAAPAIAATAVLHVWSIVRDARRRAADALA